tara:strand:- start:162 stop:413 length:252 start_codon:yes stop_codon:yes gene_type:complete
LEKLPSVYFPLVAEGSKGAEASQEVHLQQLLASMLPAHHCPEFQILVRRRHPFLMVERLLVIQLQLDSSTVVKGAISNNFKYK